ncbi:MAG: LysR family transcriptional regulator [Pseudomonadota bacterium]
MARSEQGRLTLRAIETFIAVVEAGSFAEGAQRLGAATSSVSQQITNLEAALGSRLIDRSARPLALTPAGFVFQRRALAVLDEVARAQTELAELDLTALPQLRLAIIEDFDADITPALAARLAQTLPGCNIIAHAGPSHDILAALEARDVDLVVAAELETAPDWMEQHRILRDPYLLVTAKGLVLDPAEPLRALMAAPMIRFAATQLMGRQIETHLRRLRLAPTRQFEFEANHSVMSAVAMLGGWTIVTAPGYLRAPRFHDQLSVHPLPFRSFSRTVSLHARRGVHGALPAKAAEILRDLIAQHLVVPALRDMPWLEGRLDVLQTGAAQTEGPAGGGAEQMLKLVR